MTEHIVPEDARISEQAVRRQEANAGGFATLDAAPNQKATEQTLADRPQKARGAQQPSIGTTLATAPSSKTVAVEIARLARLSPVDYERARRGKAVELGVRQSALDGWVKQKRGESAAPGGAGQALIFETLEPWNKPVGGALLLDNLAASVRKHVVVPEHADAAIALWVVLSYLHDVVDISPLLALRSPEKRCGKTTLLGLLSRVVPRPLATSNVSPAAVFRVIENWRPTLLVDEGDSFLGLREELRGVLNSGHTRDAAYVLRCVGDNHEPQLFSTWAPKLVAMIGRLPNTLADRAITIELRRRLPSEKVLRLRQADPQLFKELRRQCMRWATDQAAEIARAKPQVPDTLNDRAADNWTPLLAIAEAAGEQWPERARRAALALSGAESDAPGIGVELLVDIRAVFERMGHDRLSTFELIKELCADPERRWATWNRGSSMTARQLSDLLGGFGIVSQSVRISERTPKGYKIEQFKDAFVRYLPTAYAETAPQHRHTPTATGDCGNAESATDADMLRTEKSREAAPDNGCGGVAGGTPPPSGDEEEVLHL